MGINGKLVNIIYVKYYFKVNSKRIRKKFTKQFNYL